MRAAQLATVERPPPPLPAGGTIDLVRRLWRLPLMRSARKHRRVDGIANNVKAALVFADPARYAARELTAAAAAHLGRETAATPHRLRGSELVAHVRHGTVDSEVVKEVFVHQHYEMPAEVAAALDALPHPMRLVDLGGHVGLGGLFFLTRFPTAEVVSFEPDPLNLAVLRRTLEANREQARWRVVEACAATESGLVRFIGGESWSSRIADPDEACEGASSLSLVPTRDVFPYLEDADVLKIDIEGGEWAILADSRLEHVPARVIALEYHRFSCEAREPREQAASALEGAGYAVRDIVPSSGGIGMMWAWRTGQHS